MRSAGGGATNRSARGDKKQFVLTPKPIPHPELYLVPNRVRPVAKPPRLKNSDGLDDLGGRRPQIQHRIFGRRHLERANIVERHRWVMVLDGTVWRCVVVAP